MAYAMRKRNWPERLAGFFAAKEATRKAFGHAIPWRWIGVGHERSGKPTIELLGKAGRLLAARDVRAIHLTITHTAGNRGGRRHSRAMIYVLTPEQMRAADAAAIGVVGEDALMREAGRQLARCVRDLRIQRQAHRGVRRSGKQRRRCVRSVGGTRARVRAHRVRGADPRSRRRPAKPRRRGRARPAFRFGHLPETTEAARAALDSAIGVDGLFGTGARLPMPQAYRALARALDARRGFVLAIDIPSGIDALTGAVSDDAVRATVTVTIGAAKPGLFLDPARELVGELWYAPIGIDDGHPVVAAAHVRRARRRGVRATAAGASCDGRQTRGRCTAGDRGVRAVSRRRGALRARRGARGRRLRNGGDSTRRRERVARALDRTGRRRAFRRCVAGVDRRNASRHFATEQFDRDRPGSRTRRAHRRHRNGIPQAQYLAGRRRRQRALSSRQKPRRLAWKGCRGNAARGRVRAPFGKRHDSRRRAREPSSRIRGPNAALRRC